VLSLLTFIPLLYIAIFDKTVTRMTRQLAWILTGTQVAGVIVQLGLRSLFEPELLTLPTAFIIAAGYAYAGFRQMISGRHLQRGHLTARLTAIVLALVVPLVGSMGFFVSAQAGEQIERDALKQLQLTHRALGTNVAVWLNSNVRALQQLVSLPDIVSMDAEWQRPALEAMADTHSHIYLVGAVGLDGVSVAYNNYTTAKDYSTQSWFKEVRDGAPFALQVQRDATRDEAALVVSVPIRDQYGTTVGVGVFFGDLDAIASEVQVSQIGESGFAYVVNAENRVIAHPDSELADNLYFLLSAPPVAALREGKEGLVEFTDEEGVRWHAYVGELPEALAYDVGWGIVVQQEEAELIAPLRQFQTMAWATSIASAILVAVFASLAIRQALRPIGTLTDTATAIATGDLGHIALVESEDEMGILADVFNSMTAQLREHIGGLEQRVAERTHDLERRTQYLEASAQVAHAVAATLDPQQLLEQVVSLISEHFGFYHTGIFLLDASGEWAVLQAASSEGGQRMLARNHQLRVGRVGIVGYVTGRGEPRIALDVGEDAIYFDNPDMPETRSEMALPLRVRGEIIGALDVQSKEPEAFSEEDVSVLQTLADQVAMAISNARLFQQAQESLAAERRAYGIQSSEAWEEMLRARSTLGYRCDAGGIAPVTERFAAHDGAVEELPTVEIPVTVHGGQVIGAISARKPHNAGEWTTDEISLLETLTEQLNVALESARLHQDTQRRATRERLIGDITARIRETLDMETMLKTAAQEVRQALDLPEVVIRLTSRSANGDGGNND
jgi:GAF domain-containing protein/HAMP domain-containing protein